MAQKCPIAGTHLKQRTSPLTRSSHACAPGALMKYARSLFRSSTLRRRHARQGTASPATRAGNSCPGTQDQQHNCRGTPVPTLRINQKTNCRVTPVPTLRIKKQIMLAFASLCKDPSSTRQWPVLPPSTVTTTMARKKERKNE